MLCNTRDVAPLAEGTVSTFMQ